ncbi:MAG: glutamate--tRNA ligase [Candidatus Pacebacteria bacterium]|nr:glutamate--tRNA ligase [Candidatus Paceibacterota bacterium]
MIEKKVVTRFAPSPTGYLHVGGLRTALYAYLFAKQNNGVFLLRIEDTDRERFLETGVRNILDSLYWAGIVPDEGVVLDNENHIVQKGEHGSYIQSERLEVYSDYARFLLEKKVAYRCFCTKDRLSQIRLEMQNAGLVPKYDRHCLGLTQQEIETFTQEKFPHVIRLKIPEYEVTSFTDEIRGTIQYPNKDLDDQVLIKSDGFPTYHMAVVVDDHLMNVTHVIRGEEWISSTPKHIILYNAFGWKIPVYAHLPLLLNADRSKLSKRQGDVAVLDYKQQGYIPKAMVNFVALLGWNPGTEKEIFSLSELVDVFSLNKINKSGAYFNKEKLNWFNREYLKSMTSAEIHKSILEEIPDIQQIPGYKNSIFTKIIPIIIERMNTFCDVKEMLEKKEIQFFFTQPQYDIEMLIPKKSTGGNIFDNLKNVESILQTLDTWDRVSIKKSLWDFATERGRGEVLWPMRVALSGLEFSPDPFLIAEIVGKDETLTRLHHAFKKLQNYK